MRPEKNKKKAAQRKEETLDSGARFQCENKETTPELHLEDWQTAETGGVVLEGRSSRNRSSCPTKGGLKLVWRQWNDDFSDFFSFFFFLLLTVPGRCSYWGSPQQQKN